MPEFRQSLAIVIGIDRYAHGIPQLRSAVNDARRVGALLGDVHGYEVRAFLDEDATLDRLRALFLDELPAAVDADDRVFLYFAGHGVALDGDQGPNGYLLPQDAQRGDAGSYLYMPLLHDALLALPCRHMLVVLDSCFSGAFRWSSLRDLEPIPDVIHRERFDRYLRDPAWQVITSSAHDQTALDSLSTGSLGSRGATDGHSPFALSLFEALEGKGDVVPEGGDGVITATELYLYLEGRLQSETIAQGLRQTPRLWPLRKHDKGEFIFLAPGRTPDLPPAPPLTFDNNPYRGLSAYEKQDADLFFGRDAVVAALADRVAVQPLTVVLGASGTGKSSVVKAGLIPRLEAAGWRVVGPIRPGAAPLHALAQAVGVEGDATAENIAAGLTALCAAAPEQRVLLVVDQLEELATLTPTAEQRERTLSLFAHLLQTHGDQLRTVLTLRSDFEAQFDRSALGAWWTPGRYIVPPLSRAELREIIERPASRRVFYFQPASLVDELVDAVVATPGGLPLLSFALSEMYVRYVRRRSDDRALTREDYDALGGVIGALRSRADAEFDALDDAHRATLRRVMLRMVVPERENLARRRVMRAELEYGDAAENERVNAVVARFTSARLLVEGTDPHGDAYVEPAHDALVHAWGRLLDWIHDEDARATGLRLQHELARTAGEWQRADARSAPGLLWRDAVRSSLLTATLKDPAVLLNRREMAFAQRSVRRRRAIQRGLAAVASVIVVAGVLALMFGIVAERQRRAALEQRDEAFRQTLRAQSNQLGAQAVLALDGTGDATQAFKLASAALAADSTNTSAQRTLLRAVYGGGLFTYRGRRYAQPFYREVASGDVRVWSPDGGHSAAVSFGTDDTVILAEDGTERARVPGGFVGWSLDGRFLAAETADGAVVYDLDGVRVGGTTTDRVLEELQTPDVDDAGGEDAEHRITFEGMLNDHSFEFWGATSANGAHDGAMDFDRTAFVVRDAQGGEVGSIPGVWSYADFTADGRYLVTGSIEGDVGLWEILPVQEEPMRIARLATLGGHTDAIHAADFSPDETVVVTSSRDGTTRHWLLTGRPITSLPLPGTPGKTRLHATDDGSRVVSAGSSGAIIWTAGSDSVLRLDGLAAAVTADGGRIAVADSATLRLFDATGAPIAAIALEEPVDALAFLPGARPLVTRSGASIVIRDSLGRALTTHAVGAAEGELFPAAPDGSRVLLQRGDSVVILNLANGSILSVKGRLPASAHAVSADGAHAVLRLRRDTVGVLVTATGEIAAKLATPILNSRLIGISADGRRVLIDEINSIALRAWGTGTDVEAGSGFQIEHTDLAGNGLLATHAIDGVTRVWSEDGREIVAVSRTASGYIESIEWLASGRVLAVRGSRSVAPYGSFIDLLPIERSRLLSDPWGGTDTLTFAERRRWEVDATLRPATDADAPSSLLGLLLADLRALLPHRGGRDSAALPEEDIPARRAWEAFASSTTCASPAFDSVRMLVSCALHSGGLALLEELAAEPIFLDGPHGAGGFAPFSHAFARYNPRFVKWAVATLVPPERSRALVALAHPLYDRWLRGHARTYRLARLALERRPELRDSVRATARQQEDPGSFMREAFRALGDSLEAARHVDAKDAAWAASFWIRRSLDDTETTVAAGLDALLDRFDRQWAQTAGDALPAPVMPASTTGDPRDLWTALDAPDECEVGMGFGVRDRYCAVGLSGLLPLLVRRAGVPVFLSGPHTGTRLDLQAQRHFGHYNPDFVRWAHATLVPDSGSTAVRALAAPIYRIRLRKIARAYWIALRELDARPDLVERIASEYMSQPDPGDYIQSEMWSALPRLDDDEMQYLGGVAGGFWIRREMDGSRKEFETGLRKLLEAFDAEFLRENGG